MRSMLSGIFLILFLGSGIGCGIGGAVAGHISAESLNKVYYDDMYSNGIGNSEESEAVYADSPEDLTIAVICLLSAAAVISLGMLISANRMSQVLKQEPMKLLTTEK
ncbi:MAG TPA: hypothetical protein PLU43_05430, partial [Lachnospiraceae bacterium]|nr:hypothetical protein [Lachnospiraceae bacterium]